MYIYHGVKVYECLFLFKFVSLLHRSYVHDVLHNIRSNKESWIFNIFIIIICYQCYWPHHCMQLIRVAPWVGLMEPPSPDHTYDALRYVKKLIWNNTNWVWIDLGVKRPAPALVNMLWNEKHVYFIDLFDKWQ